MQRIFMGTKDLSWEARRAWFSAAKQKLDREMISACTEGQLLNSKEAANAQTQRFKPVLCVV